MMADYDYSWIGFYTEFATKLLEYKDDRSELIQKIKNVYKRIEMRLPKLEIDDSLLTDIDPFTVFGLFNKGITDTNRITIIKGMVSEFNVKAEIPEMFQGIPLLNNLKATFYSFKGDREERDIDNLWDLFNAAISYADNSSEQNRNEFISTYDKVIPQKSIRWNITMGLFWIRPYSFINLDSRNRWFMTLPERMPVDYISKVKPLLGKVPNAEQYIQIISLCRQVLESEGSCYKSFPELSCYAWDISEQVNVQNRRESTKADKDSEDVLEDVDDAIHYWVCAPGRFADNWDECYKKGIILIGWGEIGDLKTFDSKTEIKQKMMEVFGDDSTHTNSTYAVWQFAHDMKPGDIVFAKKGNNEIIGRGVVESDYEFDSQRTDGLNNLRHVKWTHNGDWTIGKRIAQKTLTDITQYGDLVRTISELFEEETIPDETKPVNYYPYTEEDFLDQVFIDENSYNTIVSVLKKKKNIILQGAPGVGKTFAAKRLAYSMMGVRDSSRTMMVQFHQSYSYEDFIMGFRPTEKGFELHTGVFYEFCKKAEIDSDNDYFFIIDEINRGNLNKIFGELFTLIENDKRGVELQMLYSDEKFSIPENIYIIGMMNTADRSLAMLDYALRRRFGFFELKPAFESDGFVAYQRNLDNKKFDNLISCVKDLNHVITDDESLGEGFCIGHSYFCDLKPETFDEKVLAEIVEYEIIPLFKEYWFDEPSKVREWSDNLRSAIK